MNNLGNLLHSYHDYFIVEEGEKKPLQIQNDSSQVVRIEWINNEDDYHREGKPAKIVIFNQSNSCMFEWFRHGRRHREDGPAIHYSAHNAEQWWQNGSLHREDGPAIIQHPITAGNTFQWFLHNERFNMNEWLEKIGDKLTDEEKVKVKLQYG